jgi:hypothetical protein
MGLPGFVHECSLASGRSRRETSEETGRCGHEVIYGWFWRRNGEPLSVRRRENGEPSGVQRRENGEPLILEGRRSKLALESLEVYCLRLRVQTLTQDTVNFVSALFVLSESSLPFRALSFQLLEVALQLELPRLGGVSSLGCFPLPFKLCELETR